MSRKVLPISKEEAKRLGSPWYVDTEPAYVHEADQPPEEGIHVGTDIDILTVDEDKLVLGTTVERDMYRFSRSYERAINKEVKRANQFIGGVAAAATVH